MGILGLWILSDNAVVRDFDLAEDSSPVRLYTRHAMMFVSTRFGVAHIDRKGIGTDVSNTMITVTKLEIKVILEI